VFVNRRNRLHKDCLTKSATIHLNWLKWLKLMMSVMCFYFVSVIDKATSADQHCKMPDCIDEVRSAVAWLCCAMDILTVPYQLPTRWHEKEGMVQTSTWVPQHYHSQNLQLCQLMIRSHRQNYWQQRAGQYLLLICLWISAKTSTSSTLLYLFPEYPTTKHQVKKGSSEILRFVLDEIGLFWLFIYLFIIVASGTVSTV